MTVVCMLVVPLITMEFNPGLAGYELCQVLLLVLSAGLVGNRVDHYDGQRWSEFRRMYKRTKQQQDAWKRLHAEPNIKTFDMDDV